jgi:hypothetical protein
MAALCKTAQQLTAGAGGLAAPPGRVARQATISGVCWASALATPPARPLHLRSRSRGSSCTWQTGIYDFATARGGAAAGGGTAPGSQRAASQRAIIVDAARCSELGPDALVLAPGQPMPECGAGEVLIKVAFAGVNRPDVIQRKGLYPPPMGHSPTLGLEVSGTVVRVGAGVSSHVQVGQEVCALTPGGGYAEFCAAPAGAVLPLPDGMGFRDAAALPETMFTVCYNVLMRGQLKAGETLLVHGGAGGIGTAAIMLAKAVGASVFATAGSDAIQKRYSNNIS